MSIRSKPPPFNGNLEIARFVPRLLGGSSTDALLGGAAPVRASQPMPLFVVRLDQIDQTDFIRYAKPVSWRYLILGDGPVAVAELKEGPQKQGRFSTLIHGDLAARLAAATRSAEEKYGNSGIEYEPRILEIPALYITALWLHGQKDAFFPMDPRSKSSEPIREDLEFLDHVVAAAKGKKRDGGPSAVR
jgi:hypothetical protein